MTYTRTWLRSMAEASRSAASWRSSSAVRFSWRLLYNASARQESDTRTAPAVPITFFQVAYSLAKSIQKSRAQPQTKMSPRPIKPADLLVRDVLALLFIVIPLQLPIQCRGTQAMAGMTIPPVKHRNPSSKEARG